MEQEDYMSWGSANPEQAGWYLVTLENGTVMPLYRMDYPKGNYSWQGCHSNVIASQKFPKPYQKLY
jgi:hypothetical protein